MSQRRVVVTGMGLVSPHGEDLAGAFDALVRGQSGITLNTVGDAPHSAVIPSAVCRNVDAAKVVGKSRAATIDRVSHLAVVAASAAWADAGLADVPQEERESISVALGTGGGGAQSTERAYRELFLRNRQRLSPLTVVQGMYNAAAAHVSQLLGLGGPCLTFSVACASAAAAIADSARRIRWGDCDVALAGGSEAALPYGVVKAWLSMQVLAPADEQTAASACQPFGAHRGGLVLGEGAAILVLEERERALARGARIYAELAGSGSSCDHGHITAPSVDGQLRALRGAMRDAGINPDEVRYVNAHGTATPEGDPVEIDALRQHFGDHAARLAVSATKSMHGHLMGTSGAIEALITAMVVHTGRIPPTANVTELDPACTGVDHVLGTGRDAGRVPVALSNSFAFGGSNVVLAFRAPD